MAILILTSNVKLFFAGKTKTTFKIALMENEKIISTVNMTIRFRRDDPVLKIIKKYQNRASIKLIKDKNKNIPKFDIKKMRSKSLFKILIPKKHLKK